MELPEGLLHETKNYLDMTWADSAGEEKLSGVLARGTAYLDHIAGVKLDYAEGTGARALLLDYARYALAGALQDFAGDFGGELLGLHIAWEVKQHEGADPIQ